MLDTRAPVTGNPPRPDDDVDLSDDDDQGEEGSRGPREPLIVAVGRMAEMSRGENGG